MVCKYDIIKNNIEFPFLFLLYTSFAFLISQSRHLLKYLTYIIGPFHHHHILGSKSSLSVCFIHQVNNIKTVLVFGWHHLCRIANVTFQNDYEIFCDLNIASGQLSHIIQIVSKCFRQ